uniref:Kunitz/Bovine pancreatic trypsin inhibitor domain protein n=1 Tax=Syphacia muris TaxID=451379 RepID=A0A158R656_9BILA
TSPKAGLNTKKILFSCTATVTKFVTRKSFKTFVLFFNIFLSLEIFRNVDSCDEDEDPGPCQQFQIRWYWDKLEKKCKEFHYGGCLGNRNRFESKKECLKQCLYKLNDPQTIPELCLLPPDKGKCENYRKGERFYYFDAALGKCEPFLYRGCGGNDNRFYSLQRCRTVCAERVSPHCDLRVSHCKEYSKYNYTCECNEGYRKGPNDECLDVNECILPEKVCDTNAECYNTPGSYTCRCKSGYRGNGKKCTFVGIGRAALDNKKCSKHATWSHGVCMCKEGFRGNGFNCSDVNECLQSASACHKYAECRNVEGSYTCECNPGFAGNGYFCTKENACLDPFDHGYMNQCGIEQWREHYYFDHDSKKCKQFWYDGCPGSSRNIFSKLHACELLCEFGHALDRAEPAPYKSSLYSFLNAKIRETKNDCGGPWVKRYYYDKYQKKCEAFWYSGCKGTSQNITRNRVLFPENALCDFIYFWIQSVDSNTKFAHFNIFDLNKNKSYCDCAEGFKGENCTEKAEFDPCATKPCLNGATCLPNPNNKTAFQCFCTSGFGGETCDKRPCDSSPCFNNASCAPTTAYPWFLCRCTKEYSGQYCEDGTPKYGPQVKQFSSVDDEWIEKLRKNEEAKSKQETERLLETSTVPNGWIQFLIALSLMFILYVNAIFQYFYITAKS